MEKIKGKKQRVYFAIDMKSFFASVECVERGLDPMTTNLVVADKSRTDKTICLAVTPAMKALGVKNRCRLFEIPKHVDYIIAPPRMRKYIDYAAEIYAIYLKYLSKDDIHVYSIDESFIDVTDYLSIYKMRAKEFAQKLMKEIEEKVGIPSTTGIGTNLYLAKIALDITAKHSPDRIGWLTEEKFIKELWNHTPITDFWQISHGTAQRLSHFGIYDMQGLANFPEDPLYKEFGINAELLIDHAWGRETCLMSDIKNYKSKSRSFSSSQILPKNYSFIDAKLILREMIQEGCYRLVREKTSARTIRIVVGYGNEQREFVKGARTLTSSTNLFSILCSVAEEIYDSVVDVNAPIRRIGFDFSGIESEEYEQYDMFTDMEAVRKEKSLTHSVLHIKDKYGKNAILKGADYQQGATARERNTMIGGHSGGEEQDAKRK